MDIHKPKPIHNWRDFLKEVGIIVLGVCIALAAEQAVEWWHWRGKAAYAQDQIQQELALNMFFFTERIMVADCIQSRLSMLEEKLLASGENWAPVAVMGTFGMQAGNVIAVPSRTWNATAWTAAVADTSVTHFKPERLAFYAFIYSMMDASRVLNQKELDNVAQLNVLLKPVKISSDKKLDLLAVIESERSLNRNLTLRASRQDGQWKTIGLDPAQARAQVPHQSTTWQNCQKVR